MPKAKKHKGIAKRVKVTSKGKVMVGRPGRRHLLSSKNSKRRRKLRRKKEAYSTDAKRMKKMLSES